MRKTGPIGFLDRLLHHGREIAAVVLEAGGDAIGKLVLRDEAAAAQFRRVHAELVRSVLHQALERMDMIGRPAPRYAAIGAVCSASRMRA